MSVCVCDRHISAVKSYAVDRERVISQCLSVFVTGISVLLNRMQWTENSVAIDGSLYRYHPKLHSMMMAWISELSPNTKVLFVYTTLSLLSTLSDITQLHLHHSVLTSSSNELSVLTWFSLKCYSCTIFS